MIFGFTVTPWHSRFILKKIKKLPNEDLKENNNHLE